MTTVFKRHASSVQDTKKNSRTNNKCGEKTDINFDAMLKAEAAPKNVNQLVQETTASEGKSVGVVSKKHNGISFTSTSSHKDKIIINNSVVTKSTDVGTIDDWIKKKPREVPRPPPVKKRKKKIQPESDDEKSNDGSDVYEVEKILDYKNIDNKPMYLVKWKGWASKHNTWEPYEHLEGCTKLLCEFFEKSPNNKRDNVEEELERLREELSTMTDLELKNLLKRYRKNGWLKLPTNVNRKDTEVLLRGLAKRPASDRDPEVFKRVSEELKILTLLDRRKSQLEALKEWEYEMNTVSQDSAPLKVENFYDLEGPPQNFMYINDYIPGENVEIPEDPPFGCNCKDNCDRHKVNCCGRTCNSPFPYNSYRRLRVALGTPIYECNKQCKCGPSCLNRVVQNGRNIKLCIFKTNTECGWGVKSLEKVKKGTFITVYVGEVITSEEAEKRGKIYDAVGRTYLFDLDFNETDQFPYTVDAATLGNVSHFINHSCDPNLEVYAVWINCLDPNLPKLAMFACKDINIGDEITFDYTCHSLSADETESAATTDSDLDASNGSRSRYLCRCGSKNCRRFMF